MNTIQTKGLQEIPTEFQDKVNERIAHYHAQYEQKIGTFDELHVTCKKIHQKSENGNPIYEYNANLIIGAKVHHAHAEDYDPIDGINDVLESIFQRVLKE
ncbi:MAG: hypothetical protein ACMXYA_01370 [Candidatus Woesearchaeota archaeon]